jgi:molybdenum cofactor synthesis domain-containing protein
MLAPTASLIVVGSEVLSAKVPDENGPYLARRLRQLGVELRALSVVADRLDDIVEAVDRERRRVDWLFTSGGVGPTHDDVTVAAVGRALGRPIRRLPALVEVIRTIHRLHHRGEEPPEAALRMADVPEGAELLGDQGYPTLRCANVVLLPGVPRFFAWQFERVAPLLTGTPFRLACLYLGVPEHLIAPALDAVANAHAAVEIGSYPRFDEGADHLVRLTVESRDLAAVEAALAALLAALPAGAVLRSEGP